MHDRIKQRRKELGLSAEQVASALNVSRATVYRYESAEIEKLPMDILLPLSKVLHTTPAYLLGVDLYISPEDEEVVRWATFSTDPNRKEDNMDVYLSSIKVLLRAFGYDLTYYNGVFSLLGNNGFAAVSEDEIKHLRYETAEHLKRSVDKLLAKKALEKSKEGDTP